jgi:hypothetical protein
MNSKQIATLCLSVIGIVLIVIFTPKYKITWIDSENFIRTEQTSALYKRSKGQEKYNWDKIAVYSGGVIAGCGLLMFALRDKDAAK